VVKQNMASGGRVQKIHPTVFADREVAARLASLLNTREKREFKNVKWRVRPVPTREGATK
jgi:hypothetical protein